RARQSPPHRVVAGSVVRRLLLRVLHGCLHERPREKESIDMADNKEQNKDAQSGQPVQLEKEQGRQRQGGEQQHSGQPQQGGQQQHSGQPQHGDQQQHSGQPQHGDQQQGNKADGQKQGAKPEGGQKR